MIRSQLTAEAGSNIAVIGAYREKGGIGSRISTGGRVYISSKIGIGASSSKDVFRLYRVPPLLYRALSIVYSGGVGE